MYPVLFSFVGQRTKRVNRRLFRLISRARTLVLEDENVSIVFNGYSSILEMHKPLETLSETKHHLRNACCKSLHVSLELFPRVQNKIVRALVVFFFVTSMTEFVERHYRSFPVFVDVNVIGAVHQFFLITPRMLSAGFDLHSDFRRTLRSFFRFEFDFHCTFAVRD